MNMAAVFADSRFCRMVDVHTLYKKRMGERLVQIVKNTSHQRNKLGNKLKFSFLFLHLLLLRSSFYSWLLRVHITVHFAFNIIIITHCLEKIVKLAKLWQTEKYMMQVPVLAHFVKRERSCNWCAAALRKRFTTGVYIINSLGWPRILLHFYPNVTSAFQQESSF